MERPEMLEQAGATRAASVEAHLDAVLHDCYRRLVVELYAAFGDLREAEALTREAFGRAAASGRRFQRVDRPEAWLREVAVRIRRNRRGRLDRTRTEAPPVAGPAASEEHVAAVGAFRDLPAEERTVLAFHDLAELDVAEVADLLAVTDGTVESRLRRGREALGRLLGEAPTDLDERLRGYARRAEEEVVVPDLDAIIARGAQLRRSRRRRAALASAAVVAALGAGNLAVSGLRSPDADTTPTPDVKAWPGGSDLPEASAGTYEMELHREGFPVTARFTIPEGWDGWFGPVRGLGDGRVGVLIGDVEDVATRVCGGAVSEMRPVGNTASELLEALTEIPRHALVDEPEQVSFAGLPATHLTLMGGSNATCGERSVLELWNAPGAGLLIPALGPGATIDLWVVDFGGEAILVSASSARATPAWARRELDGIVDSIEFERTS